ncbi:uncharacterized protein LOC111884141 [Lactuca sativa]|uniref:uncharacterized protein LOC111884141 n=1 Tax=Lactuca sativa TaxID=4236 RepID=UPI000CD87B29|nr:uncharacterized protein LOC111884141 [Lactuca sativa]
MAGKGSRTDPAWQYGVEKQVPAEGAMKGYKYLMCKFCEKIITRGVHRLKAHLAGTHKNTSPCPLVPPVVKEEMKQFLKDFESSKFRYQRNFEEAINGGAYFVGSGGVNGSVGANAPEHGNCCPSVQRGVRGPMDRFVNTPGDDEEGPTSGGKMTPTTVREQRNKVCLDIGRFFYENGIPFNVANSPSFVSMLRSVGNYGRGLKPPTMYELRNWILQEEVKTTNATVDEIKATWKTTRVSLLSDGWSDMRNKSLINFLVNNQHGTVFLKTVDASDCIKNAQKLFELLDGVIEEIGEDVVIQVVTDNASAYKAAGTLLMEKRKSLYWTPCATHCIDPMLEKIGDLTQQKNALIKAKKG